MALPGRTYTPQKSRAFIILVTVLWVIALGAVALMIWFWQTGAFAAPTTTTSTTTTLAPTTTLPPTTTTELPTTTTTTLPPPLSVSAGGDVMGAGRVGTFIDKNGGAAAFEGVKSYMEGAHLAFVNVEGPISDKGTRNSIKEYTFRSSPALLDGLLSAGIDMVSLANNHVLDYGSKALYDCIERLDTAGIKHAGAGSDLGTASAPVVLDTPAGRVAFIAASQITESFAATDKRAGTFYIYDTAKSKKTLTDKVAEAATQADFVVVSLHWGTEYDATADSTEIEFAHQIVDAGADLILGHHPHVIQGLEIYKDRLIVYSMGDFVWDWHSAYTGESFVLQVTLPPDGAPWGTIVPVFLSTKTGAPALADAKTADRILTRLTKLSTQLGLELTRDGDVATFGTPPPQESTTTVGATTTTLASPAGTTTTVRTP